MRETRQATKTEIGKTLRCAALPADEGGVSKTPRRREASRPVRFRVHSEETQGRQAVREQKRYIFHQGGSWFVRYYDSALKSDGTVERQQFCKKLPVPFCDEYRTRKSVRPFAEDILMPLNRGTVTVASTMRVVDFIENTYLPKLEEKKRQSTMKGYRDIFRLHLKNLSVRQPCGSFAPWTASGFSRRSPSKPRRNRAVR